MPKSGQRAVQEDLRIAIGEWIVAQTLAGASELEILAGICERMNLAGLSLMRASVAHDLLDPTFDARGVRWLRDRGALEEEFPRSDDPLANQDWMRSPFFHLLESREPILRRRLDATYRRGEFPMLDGFQDGGATDYVAIASRVGESVRLGEGEGVVASWTTDNPGGFSATQIQLLAGVMPHLTLVFMLRTMNRTARTLIQTYLGSNAAERVLAGNIVRGRAEPIRAVVWFSDLVGFTRISDTASAGTVLELLNDYAEAQVEEIETHGGHVLKFIGDGILAIFPQEDMPIRLRCRRMAASLRVCAFPPSSSLIPSSSFPNHTRPLVGGESQLRHRNNVDLPEPEGPRMLTTSPWVTAKSIPSSTRFVPNVLQICWHRIAQAPGTTLSVMDDSRSSRAHQGVCRQPTFHPLRPCRTRSIQRPIGQCDGDVDLDRGVRLGHCRFGKEHEFGHGHDGK